MTPRDQLRAATLVAVAAAASLGALELAPAATTRGRWDDDQEPRRTPQRVPDQPPTARRPWRRLSPLQKATYWLVMDGHAGPWDGRQIHAMGGLMTYGWLPSQPYRAALRVLRDAGCTIHLRTYEGPVESWLWRVSRGSKEWQIGSLQALVDWAARFRLEQEDDGA